MRRQAHAHAARAGARSLRSLFYAALVGLALLTAACADDGTAPEPETDDDLQAEAVRAVDAGARVRDAGAAAVTPGRLPPVSSLSGNGPFATSENLASGPRGQSGLFYRFQEPAQTCSFKTGTWFDAFPVPGGALAVSLRPDGPGA